MSKSESKLEVARMAKSQIRTMADIEAFEAIPLEQRLGGIENTYDLIRRTATANPAAPALLSLGDEDPLQVKAQLTYDGMLAKITRAANAFTSLGVGPEDVISL